MTLLTEVYFDDNVDIEKLFEDIREITQTNLVTHNERISTVTQTFTYSLPVSVNPNRPGIILTCAIIGKRCEEDIYDETGEFLEEVECWADLAIFTKESQLAPTETHVGYLLSLSSRGYKFRWRNAYDDIIYDGKDFEAFLDFCALGEVFNKD